MNPYREEPKAEYVNLFGAYELPAVKRKVLNPRTELVKYFHDRALDKNGKKLTGSGIGFLLAHCSTLDLASFKANLEESQKKNPEFIWNKAFWGTLKSK